jgi:hypothetical protein
MPRLFTVARWDEDLVRDDVCGYVVSAPRRSLVLVPLRDVGRSPIGSPGAVLTQRLLGWVSLSPFRLACKQPTTIRADNVVVSCRRRWGHRVAVHRRARRSDW